MTAQREVTTRRAARAPMSRFEGYLSLWVLLCIGAGIILGQLFPGTFQAIGRLEVARVNLPVGLLIWVMIIPMLMKVDFGALTCRAARADTCSRARRWPTSCARAAGCVVWMGTRAGMEARLVTARGYELASIRAVALRGKGLAVKLLLPLNLLIGFWQAARTIFRLRPDVVLGMGGYVAFPGGMMASLLARPLAVHELNAIAGLTNRILAGVADRKMTAFPQALKGAEWTGNPARGDIAAVADPDARYARRSGPLRLLVVGGSGGAQALNECVPRALALLEPRPSVVTRSTRPA